MEAGKLQERLQKRHQARAEEAERRREARESQAVLEEKGEYFCGSFNAERTAIEELLSGCGAVTSRLEEATARTLQLQKFLNDSTGFLTQYELRQAQAGLQKLQSGLSEAREEALPRKKFTFRARTRAAEKTPETADACTPADKTPETADACTPADDKTPDACTPADDKTPDACTPADDGVSKLHAPAESEQCSFSNMDGVRLTKTAEQIQKRDVLLSHLTNCKVRLLGSPSTLHLKHIVGCEILCGPVSSSVFIDHCKDSTLALPCQQLRTHNTTDTKVYLHVTSRAIIEDCRGVSFAPFSWSYPALEEDFVTSGLDRDRNNWSQVDDFNWLAAGTHSPNWSVIPEEERKTTWDP